LIRSGRSEVLSGRRCQLFFNPVFVSPIVSCPLLFCLFLQRMKQKMEQPCATTFSLASRLISHIMECSNFFLYLLHENCMKILVTGGAGYIGSICVKQLVNKGHEITVFDNFSEGHRKAIDSRAMLITGDLQNRCDIEDALEKMRPDAVVHFA